MFTSRVFNDFLVRQSYFTLERARKSRYTGSVNSPGEEAFMKERHKLVYIPEMVEKLGYDSAISDEKVYIKRTLRARGLKKASRD